MKIAILLPLLACVSIALAQTTPASQPASMPTTTHVTDPWTGARVPTSSIGVGLLGTPATTSAPAVNPGWRYCQCPGL